MKALLLLTVVYSVAITACSYDASPLAPSEWDAFFYPPELAPVIEWIDADPWIHPLIGEQSGRWVRRYARGIEWDYSLTATPDIGASADLSRRVIRWQPLNAPSNSSLAKLAGTVLHEVRHLQGYKHTCGSHDLFAGDRTMEEGGAFAVQILFLEHHHHRYEADWLRRNYIGC